MRFFTRQWCDGELSEEDAERVPGLYAAHLRSLTERLTPRIRQFAAEINLHDGLIRGVEHDEHARTLNLRVRAGDKQVGYCDVDLAYLDAAPDPRAVHVLHRMGRDPRYELRYDELDTGESTPFVHRLLFWPEDEVTIGFRELAWRRIPRRDRSGAA